MISPMFQFGDLGLQTLKGFDEPVRAWVVTGKLEVESQSQAIHLADKLTPLVGRDNDVTKLLRCWYQAKNGNGQVVLICGEPGIGKSRLIRALLDRLGKERFALLHYFGSREELLVEVLREGERRRSDPRATMNRSRSVETRKRAALTVSSSASRVVQ